MGRLQNGVLKSKIRDKQDILDIDELGENGVKNMLFTLFCL